MRPRFLLWALVPCLLAAQSVSDLQKAFEKKVTEYQKGFEAKASSVSFDVDF